MRSSPSLGSELNRALTEAKKRFPLYWYEIFKKWETQIRLKWSLKGKNSNDVS